MRGGPPRHLAQACGTLCLLAQACGSARRELLVFPSGHSARMAQREPEIHAHQIAALVLNCLWLTEEQNAREAEASVSARWTPCELHLATSGSPGTSPLEPLALRSSWGKDASPLA